MHTPISPSSAIFLKTEGSKYAFSSHSLICGAISPAQNSRTVACSALCSSVSSKSIILVVMVRFESIEKFSISRAFSRKRTMIDIANAIKIIDRETSVLGPEKAALADSVGRVLREKIIADTDLPPFDRSQMDGYAVVADDTKRSPVKPKLVGESAAGRGWHKTLKRGETIRI